MPAASNAATIRSLVSTRPPIIPSEASSLLMVGTDTPELLAASACDQTSSARARLISTASPADSMGIRSARNFCLLGREGDGRRREDVKAQRIRAGGNRGLSVVREKTRP